MAATLPPQPLDFERPIVELERKIEELKALSGLERISFAQEIAQLEAKAERLRREIFSKLTPWQRTQLSRHPNRPYTLDYLASAFDGFLELHGDRLFRDDPAIVGGLALLEGRRVVVVGHQKGRTTKEKVQRNFGMPNPEGYRKALRLMQLAEKFGLPLVTFVDTPGAFPGVEAEARGQAEAIARNLKAMAALATPIVCVVIGEGGSGGALAIGVGDRVLMLEHAVYSVISPEGCAAILWKDGTQADRAAAALRLTAQDALEFGVIDAVVPEPVGGAHRDPAATADAVRRAVVAALDELAALPVETLLAQRYEKYRRIGRFVEPAAVVR
ncbi:MAG TPA: acetyl-CoA carboxylase carboxyltransferase subunit alpha [Thermodesulfobacteriota bacterium]|nr:acetyl-CoA carboxylase carboxyltransferase subunit alpha [Thermodesulfobacteriota bacterium]